MDRQLRRPCQGLWNIIRFNWPFYAVSFFLMGCGLAVFFLGTNLLSSLAAFLVLLIFVPVALSLSISWYIYDRSGLYQMQWLSDAGTRLNGKIINIHAGFDEFSALLAAQYKGASLEVFDFYNPDQHTEPSIKRARKSLPPWPGTKSIQTSAIPVQQKSCSRVFLLFAAHEIRDRQERALFFSQLRSSLDHNGRIIVMEHLRNLPNFIAYNIGFFHFLPLREWKATFRESGLRICSRQTFTPFLNLFILAPHADTL